MDVANNPQPPPPTPSTFQDASSAASPDHERSDSTAWINALCHFIVRTTHHPIPRMASFPVAVRLRSPCYEGKLRSSELRYIQGHRMYFFPIDLQGNECFWIFLEKRLDSKSFLNPSNLSLAIPFERFAIRPQDVQTDTLQCPIPKAQGP